MPLIFGFIYLNVAAILNVYFIVSSAIRIGTQEVLFRKGIVAGPNSPAPAGSGKSRSIAAAKDNGVESTEKALPKPKAKGGGSGKGGSAKATGNKASTNGSASSPNGSSASSDSGDDAGEAAKKQHPRSKAKKERKAR